MDSSSSSPPSKKVTTDSLQNHIPDEPSPVALLFVEYVSVLNDVRLCSSSLSLPVLLSV